MDGLRVPKIIDAWLTLLKHHKWIALLIIAGLGSNGAHAWHGHTQAEALKATEDAMMIYANLSHIPKVSDITKPAISKTYDDSEIRRQIKELRNFHALN